MGDAASEKVILDNSDRLTHKEEKELCASYHDLTEQFKDWIKDESARLGWKRDKKPQDPEAYAKTLKDFKDYKNTVNRAFGFPEDEEPEPTFKGESTLEILTRAMWIESREVRMPPDMQNSVTKCLELRNRVNRHWASLTKKDRPHGGNWKKHLRVMRNHEFFEKMIHFFSRLLWNAEHYIATEVFKFLRDANNMTNEIMEAWEKYRKNGVGRIQATLITHAAIARLFRAERDLMNEMDYEAAGHIDAVTAMTNWYNKRDLSLLNVENPDYPAGLLADIRALSQGGYEDQEVYSAKTIRDNLELLHFPTTKILSNFRAISEMWDSQAELFPVPGYPLDLRHIYPGNLGDKNQAQSSKGKKRQSDDRQHGARKKLKTEYGEHVEIIWKHLNEMKTLHSFEVTLNEFGGGNHEFKLVGPGQKAPYKPEDQISLQLSWILHHKAQLLMTTSFSIQLLLKIDQLFDQQDVRSRKLLQHQNVEETGKRPLERKLKQWHLDKSGKWRYIHDDNQWKTVLADLKRHLRNQQHRLPTFYGKFHWAVDSEGNEAYRVVRGNQQATVPIQQHERLYKIDESPDFPPNQEVDVNWFVGLGEEDSEFHIRHQPLFNGHVALQRRLVDYNADLINENNRLSIFVFAHLILAVNVLEQATDSTAQQDRAVLDHNPEWFPADIPTNATELLELVQRRLPRTAEGQFDFSEAVMKMPKPVQTLFAIFVNEESDPRLDLFARQLHEYQSDGSEPPIDAEKQLPWPTLVSILKKNLPKLACSDVERDYCRIGQRYEGYLAKIGERVGCVKRKVNGDAVETAREYHARLLYFILDDFKTQEDANKPQKGKKGKAWKSSTKLKNVTIFLSEKKKEDKADEAVRKKALEKLYKK